MAADTALDTWMVHDGVIPGPWGVLTPHILQSLFVKNMYKYLTISMKQNLPVVCHSPLLRRDLYSVLTIRCS